MRAAVSVSRMAVWMRSAISREHRVPDVVTEVVVDRLEPVQVQVEQGHRLTVAVEAGDGLLQPVVEQHPVGQAGQVVVGGELAQEPLGILQIGDVPGHQ